MPRPRRQKPKAPLLNLHVELKDQEVLREIAYSLGLIVPNGKNAGIGSITALVTLIARQQKIKLAKNMAIDGNPTRIYFKNRLLSFEGDVLAARSEYEHELGSRPAGSILGSLNPGENIQLENGYFILDHDLSLIQDWQII